MRLALSIQFSKLLPPSCHRIMIANSRLYSLLACLPFLAACSNQDPAPISLKEALTFHASFDNGVDADFAKGDATLYHLASPNPETVETGPPPEATVKADGQFGKSLHFNTPEGVSGTRAFYKLPQNFEYQKSDWSGSVSFWLKVMPKEDLRPGWTDPVQLTPRSALDSCLWVDFHRDEHRQFRMGAFPDRKYWNPNNIPNPEVPDGQRPLIPVIESPFSRDLWTHIVITFRGFNNSGKDGVATLYMDGELYDTLTGWEQIYTWDLETAQIRLGVNYVGALDELSCFNKELSAREVAALHSLEGGVNSLLQ